MAFSKDTFRFLYDLQANNDKAWFDANRDRYEAHWRTAALDVIATLSESMSKLNPSLRAEPKLNGSLRRINRDVRFSKDKSPYNARLHMVFWAGDHPNRSPGMHVVLTPEGVGYGAGQWSIEPARLKMFRQRIVDEADGDALIVALEAAAEIGCTMDQPDLSRVPKGFDVEGRRAELLRYKGFVARTHGPPSSANHVIGEHAEDWINEKTRVLLPLIRWLST